MRLAQISPYGSPTLSWGFMGLPTMHQTSIQTSVMLRSHLGRRCEQVRCCCCCCEQVVHSSKTGPDTLSTAMFRSPNKCARMGASLVELRSVPKRCIEQVWKALAHYCWHPLYTLGEFLVYLSIYVSAAICAFYNGQGNYTLYNRKSKYPCRISCLYLSM